MQTVFDIGMYDGADTAYYLESGYRVVAVEANPALVDRANELFKAEISSGLLTCVNAAMSAETGPVELILSGDDPGSSSVFSERVAHKRPIASITVPGMTIHELISQYGVPYYLKVDIEGSDRLCILALTAGACPQYLSFEIGDDINELVEHAISIGYNRFKIIDQDTFRELANQDCFYDRAARRLVRCLGYDEPAKIRRAGRFFSSDRCSGPGPWQSDGRWNSGNEILARWRKSRADAPKSGWYDIHAAL